MQIDYKAIGLRIKKIRTSKHITQEKLAEITQFSVPHISNIERGETKLSLPALVCIANALESSLDELVCDNLKVAKSIFYNDISNEIQDCNELEIRIISDVVKSIKSSLRTRLENNIE